MLLQNAGGDEISAYCILDSDYHTPKEVEARQKDAEGKNVRLHIWLRKEIENYLVLPGTIQRVIAQGCDEPPSVDEITAKLLQIAESNKNDVSKTREKDKRRQMKKLERFLIRSGL